VHTGGATHGAATNAATGQAPPKLPQNAAAHKEHAELCILCQVARDQKTVTVLNIPEYPGTTMEGRVKLRVVPREVPNFLGMMRNQWSEMLTPE